MLRWEDAEAEESVARHAAAQAARWAHYLAEVRRRRLILTAAWAAEARAAGAAETPETPDVADDTPRG